MRAELQGLGKAVLEYQKQQAAANKAVAVASAIEASDAGA